ncbi:MAG: glycosyltransferase family 2 protein [Gemmatimonadetes bacterium]|nr:glycosyltransferase family 2 protein [Gemmatimonadota bacterium]
MTERASITAIVATYNEERNIEACLASLAWCDEIIVVDSHSTDRTPALARAHSKVRFFQREYLGDGSQRNWAINQATTEWIMVLDSDERCPPELAAEIDGLLRSTPVANAFTIRRRTYVLGKQLRYSGWQNDRVVRLARRALARYTRLRVHAKLEASGPSPVLGHAIDHHMVDCFHDYVLRINRYGYWGAAQSWRDGVGQSLPGILIRPPWRFVRTYLLQLGFLDGIRGLAFCILQAYATYLKWALLWSWHANAKRGIAPPLPRFDEDPAVWRGTADHASRLAAKPSSRTSALPAPNQ